MFSWLSKNPKTPKTPKTLTTDEVIQWFTPFALVRNVNTIESHIDSLTKESESLVSNWEQLYKYCLYDIGYGPTTTNRDYEVIKSVREFNPYQLEVTSGEFQIETLKTTEQLNQMTKKEFVLLFAEKMDAILKLKEDAYEKQIKKKTEDKNNEYRENYQKRVDEFCQTNPDSCIKDKYGNIVPELIDLGGGKPKKSKKKSRKRNASKRRNRRTRRTRNYKKK